MSFLMIGGAVAVGAAFGYGAQRGAFCMNSGFRGALVGDWTKVKALGLAVAVQLVALPGIFASGLAQPAELPLSPIGAILGGLLFGVSMRWAGSCAAGVWYKVGAGNPEAILAILGMAVGATATDSGPLRGIRASLQSPTFASAPGYSPVASVAVGLALLIALASLEDGQAGAWSWRRTGLFIGGVAALAWPVSAVSGRYFGLAVVPGTTGLLAAAAGRPFPAWDASLVLGILVGGWLGARKMRPGAPSGSGSLGLLKRFTGGLGLGIGASVAMGCTVGQGLTGLALLAPSSFLVMGAIFAGSALASVVEHRQPSAGAASPIESRRSG